MAKRKVFVSYDHSKDLRYKDILRAWDTNENFDFDFEFDQRSPNVAIDSTNAAIIKSALTSKMKEATYLLVIVGAKSATSKWMACKWMAWEISRAKEWDIKLKLAAVRISAGYALPSGISSSNTAITNGFTQEGIIAALDKASNTY